MSAAFPDVLVVPAMPLHGQPAVSLAEALSCPGLRGYEVLREACPSVRVVLAVESLDLDNAGVGRQEQARQVRAADATDEATVRELASRVGALEIWEVSAGSGSTLLEAMACETGRRMGSAVRMAVSSPWCVLIGDAYGAAKTALAHFSFGVEPVATCREVEPHPSVYRLGRCLGDGGMAWRAYSYAGAFSYSPPHGGFIDPQGKPLFRRQDFPPMYELDYGLALGTAAGLAALQSRMEEQPDVLVPSHDSILLMGLLDVARVEALARNKA